MQPTLQLAHPLELAPPLDLSPRLVQGAPAADRPRMVGLATLALAATESAQDIVFPLGTPIARAWRITSGTRRGPIAIALNERPLEVQPTLQLAPPLEPLTPPMAPMRPLSPCPVAERAVRGVGNRSRSPRRSRSRDLELRGRSTS